MGVARVTASRASVRAPDESIDQNLAQFYDQLLTVLGQPVVRDGQWQLLDCTPGWDGNWTHDCFLVFAWRGAGGERVIVSVNYAPNESQCHVRLPFADLAAKKWRLEDQLAAARYDWNGDDLTGRGLFLDMKPWQSSIFFLMNLSVP